MSALVSLATLLAPFCSILVATRWYARRSIRDYETYRTALTEFQSWRRNNPLVVVPGKVRSAEYELASIFHGARLTDGPASLPVS